MSETSGVSSGLSLETQLLCRTCERLLDLDFRTNRLAGKGYLPKSLSQAYNDAVHKIPEAMQNVVTSQLCYSNRDDGTREVRENAPTIPRMQDASGTSDASAIQSAPDAPQMPVVDRGEGIVWIAAVTRLAREVSEAESKEAYSRSRAAWGILMYQVIVLVAAVFGFVLLNRYHILSVNLIPDVAVDNIFWGALAGLIGAITYALFGLYSHMIHRTLDRDHLLWYIVKPLTGAILGSFVSNAVIVLLNGLTGHSLSLAGTADAVSGTANAVSTVGSAVASAGASSGAGVSIIPALTFLLVAFFAGYSERFTSSIMEAFASRITGTDPSPEVDASSRAVTPKSSQSGGAGAGLGSGNGPS